MATSKDDILKAIEEMSVMELVDLISDIEEKFGVTAAAAVAAAPAAGGSDDAPAACLLYTSPSPRDISGSRMPSSA